MKRFRDLIEENTEALKVREFQDEIDKLRIEKENSKEPDLVQIKIDTVQQKLNTFMEL